jgi:hypothetical protein
MNSRYWDGSGRDCQRRGLGKNGADPALAGVIDHLLDLAKMPKHSSAALKHYNGMLDYINGPLR